jgi:hypothetical protein
MWLEVRARVSRLTLRFEPSGVEYVIEAGDHVLIEWPDAPEGFHGGFDYESDNMLAVLAPGGPENLHVFDSRGEQLVVDP